MGGALEDLPGITEELTIPWDGPFRLLPRGVKVLTVELKASLWELPIEFRSARGGEPRDLPGTLMNPPEA